MLNGIIAKGFIGPTTWKPTIKPKTFTSIRKGLEYLAYVQLAGITPIDQIFEIFI